ncbi:hypothetical protein RF11_08192 [Thelohanellus kitauei]|uniref:Uncharacterized protein n=1 Tax=Thelohanellus kitauei TaxID=669202 RepID=A0A0C2N2I3_THEKT|nr:hypothetical protein RF11_08192 [Thelohanellus kitauei]
MKIKTSKDFHTILKIEPVLESNSPYTLKSIMSNEVEHIALLSNRFCHKEWFMMLLSASGCLVLVIGACILVFYKIIVPNIPIPPPNLTYIVEYSDTNNSV